MRAQRTAMLSNMSNTGDAEQASTAPPRLKLKQGPAWWIAALLFAVMYLGVNLIYGASTAPPEQPVVDDRGRTVVSLSLIGLVPAEDSVRLKLLLEPTEDLISDGALTEQVSVNLLSIPRTVTFERGTRALSTDIEVVAVDGTFERYPFDSYQVPIVATVNATDDEGRERALPTDLIVWGKFPGWRTDPTTSREVEPEEWGLAEDVRPAIDEGRIAVAFVDASRNGSTMSIVVLLLTAMVVLALLALVVARAVATRERRIEPTLAGWFAALLFAMVPLRTNFPGAPPIGVWMDFLVFLWVLMGLMVALSLFIASWLRYTPAPDST